jgi:glucans biosynthesis protein C
MVEGKIHYINNIKSFLALLVIVFHTNSAYGGEGGWYYVEPTNDVIAVSILTLVNALCQSFFMGLFFFIAAYFSPKSYDKKGFYTFLKGRTSKLLIPAFFYFFVLNPLCINMVQEQEYRSSLGFYNMWFIMALFYFTLIYAIGRKINLAKSPKWDFPNAKKIFVFILFMGVLNFIVRLFFPTNRMYIHDFTLGYFPQYIVLFTLGVIAYRNNWLDQINERLANMYFRISIFSIITMPVVFFLSTLHSDSLSNFYGGFTFESLYYSFWEPFTYVGIILKILIYFKKHFNFTTPLLSLISRSSYSIYIIQAPIIVGLQILFGSIDLYIMIKVIMVIVLTFVFSLGISILLLRIPVLNKII